MAKTLILTGASKGIGLAIARYLISESHNVVLLARSSAPLNELVNLAPSRVRGLPGDLNDFSLAQMAVEVAVKEFGGLDGLIVNHGAMFGVDKVADCDVDDWHRMFDINFHSVVVFTKAALPELRKSKGSIVYTSSGAAIGAYSAWGAYSAAKAAVNSLARTIANEEPEVSVVSIRPGVVDTDMQRDLRETHVAKMAEKDNTKFRELHQNKQLLSPEQPGHVIAKLGVNPDPSLRGQFLSWDSKELSKYQ